jgi:hypothetical protein
MDLEDRVRMMDATMGVKYQNIIVEIINMLKDINQKLKEQEFEDLVNNLFL